MFERAHGTQGLPDASRRGAGGRASVEGKAGLDFRSCHFRSSIVYIHSHSFEEQLQRALKPSSILTSWLVLAAPFSQIDAVVDW